MDIYCVKCRTKTSNKDETTGTSKNGRKMLKAKCAKCGTTKNVFQAGGTTKPTALKGEGFVDEIRSLFV